MGLNGQTLGDRALKVENAKSARETTPQGAANPYTAMQLQQMQQLQLQQMQSSSLAAQVAFHLLSLLYCQYVWVLVRSPPNFEFHTTLSITCDSLPSTQGSRGVMLWTCDSFESSHCTSHL